MTPLAALLLPLLSLCTAAAADRPPPWEHRGITFTGGRYCPGVVLGSRAANASLDHLATTGANWVAIVVTNYQVSINTTEIFPLFNASTWPHNYYTYVTVTDAELELAVQRAKQRGLKVMLKPHVDPLTDNAPIGKTWRGDIGQFFAPRQWDAWFESYGTMLLHYASMGERLGVEMLSMNCELIAANNQTARWRELVSRTRKVFSGRLTTAPNGHGHEYWVDWFDVLDIIGVDFYDQIAGESVQEMQASWRVALSRLETGLVRKFNKSLIFTEIGYCAGGCSRNGSHGGSATNATLQRQADHYEALFLAAAGHESWFRGAFWWNWDSDPAVAAGDGCLNPAWKPAEAVLRRYYRATSPPPAPATAWLPSCVGPGRCTT